MIQDKHLITEVTLAELVLNSLLYYLEDQNYEIHYQKTLSVKRLLLFQEQND